MSANKEATSSSSSGDAHAEKSVDKLNVREFRERFCIPNGVSVELTDGEAVSTEKNEDNAIFFTKEQFNAGLRFPLSSLFKEFLHFTQIPPAYIHPNMVRVLMGCSILGMLFDLDLSLLEVLFIYLIKKVKNDIFSFVASLPSLQLVTSLPDSTKGAAKGHVLVKGLWAGLAVHPDRPFAPNQSLKVPGMTKLLLGKLVEWVEKASFDRLNRLFEIAVAERSCETFLSAQNLRSGTQEPQSYVLNILPRRLPKEVVAGEHFVLKDLPFYAAVRNVDARSRKARLNKWEKKRQEGLLRKAPGDKQPASSPPAGTPAKKKKKLPDIAVLPSVSSGSRRLASLNHSGPSMSVAGRLALLAEEATSINQPGSPHPDADAAGASCAAALPPTAPPTEEMGAESQGLPPCEPSPFAFVPMKGPTTRRSRPARDLKSGLIGRLQDRFLETIEVSCSSVQEDNPEGSEMEMAEENPTAPVLVPDGGSSGETQPSLLNALSGRVLMMRLASLLAFSLCGVGRDVEAGFHPLGFWKWYNLLLDFFHLDVFVIWVVILHFLFVGFCGGERYSRHGSTTRSFSTYYIANYMKAFVSQRENSEKELRLRLEQAKASLSAARGANEALRIELAEAKSREESTDARLHEAEDEMTQLRGEVRQLWTEVSIKKKQREDFQLRLSAQKEELEAEFAAEMEELEADYQKQVDEMYFLATVAV
ncbi:hypothetical protein AAG906_004263 [Vitis piasezkii]